MLLEPGRVMGERAVGERRGVRVVAVHHRPRCVFGDKRLRLGVRRAAVGAQRDLDDQRDDHGCSERGQGDDRPQPSDVHRVEPPARGNPDGEGEQAGDGVRRDGEVSPDPMRQQERVVQRPGSEYR